MKSTAHSNRGELRLIARIAHLHYVAGLTQKEIGIQLGLNPVKVNRLVRQAHELGIVTISVTSPEGIYAEEAQALIDKYELKDAVVVSTAEPGPDLYVSLAQGTVEWLSQQLTDGLVIGIGQGRTISYLPEVFTPAQPVDCVFAEVVGGASENNDGFANYNVTSQMAQLVGGGTNYIYAPTVVSSAEACNVLKREPAVANALNRARQADIVLHSVGPVDTSALLYVHGYINDEDLTALKTRGAVGDTLGRYFDHEGSAVPHPLDERILGLTLADLSNIPHSVMIAGGPEKVEALDAALRGGFVNVVVTDVTTAHALI